MRLVVIAVGVGLAEYYLDVQGDSLMGEWGRREGG